MMSYIPNYDGRFKRLPHNAPPGFLVSVTFHLVDALPVAARDLAQEYAIAAAAGEASYIAERYLDRGYGSCLLVDQAAKVVEDRLLACDGKGYRLLAWVVMPNHVHVLVRILEARALSIAVQGWKSVSAHLLNAQLAREGQLWQKGYHDRLIRNEKHLLNVVRYIHNNPVKAGLADDPRAWQSSSARRVETIEATFHPPWDE